MRHHADMDFNPMAIKSPVALGERLEVQNEGLFIWRDGSREAEGSHVICSEPQTAHVVKVEKAADVLLLHDTLVMLMLAHVILTLFAPNNLLFSCQRDERICAIL